MICDRYFIAFSKLIVSVVLMISFGWLGLFNGDKANSIDGRANTGL